MELDEDKKKSSRERKEALKTYRGLSDESLKEWAARGNELAQALIYERAQTTIDYNITVFDD
jgi:hypothetical protein